MRGTLKEKRGQSHILDFVPSRKRADCLLKIENVEKNVNRLLEVVLVHWKENNVYHPKVLCLFGATQTGKSTLACMIRMQSGSLKGQTGRKKFCAISQAI